MVRTSIETKNQYSSDELVVEKKTCSKWITLWYNGIIVTVDADELLRAVKYVKGDIII